MGIHVPRGNRELSELLGRLWNGPEGKKLITGLEERYGKERALQVQYNIDLYVHSQTLTEFFGLEDEEFRKALKDALESHETRTIYFLDILGAEAWANPMFHSYLYEQIPVYVRRNHSNIWNLVVTNDLIKQKIEQRLAKWVDIDEVMPNYNSGGEADLHMVRILSWDEKDMKSDVAQDLIDFHKEVNIPLFYLPRDFCSIGLGETLAEFHLAVDKNHKPVPNGCWIYHTPRGEAPKRERYKKNMLIQDPWAAITSFLRVEQCVFALEKRRQLLGKP